ncbi:hypothetical protein CsSME_00015647 [Camellia sinensis var. sinensis]
MVGCFVAGISVGYAIMIALVYTTEISLASSHGFLTSFPEVFINAGILLGYVSNFAFSKLPLHLGRRFMLGVGAIPSVFLVVGVLAMSELPQWLVLQGQLSEAQRVLQNISDSKEEAKNRNIRRVQRGRRSAAKNQSRQKGLKGSLRPPDTSHPTHPYCRYRNSLLPAIVRH